VRKVREKKSERTFQGKKKHRSTDPGKPISIRSGDPLQEKKGKKHGKRLKGRRAGDPGGGL